MAIDFFRAITDPALIEQRRERTGGRAPRPTVVVAQTHYENPHIGTRYGSHMPIDLDPHWSWRNPLNLLPAILLLALIIALAGTIGAML